MTISFDPTLRKADTMTDPTGSVLRKEGAFWTIVFNGDVLLLENRPGLEYLALLLEYPGQEIHVLNLLLLTTGSDDLIARRSAPRGAFDRPGPDGGAALDADSRAAYKRRFHELSVELRSAEQHGEAQRAERVRLAMDLIAFRRALALGLGAKEDREGSAAASARVMVTIGIRTAIETIRATAPVLARHLSSSVTTGYFCSYTPATRRQINEGS